MESFEFDTPRFEGREVTEQDLKKLGVYDSLRSFVDKIEDLRGCPPNIVIGEVLKNITFIQNKFSKQTVKKRNKYVMGLGVYNQLWYDNVRKLKMIKPSNVPFQKIYRPYEGQDLTNKTLLIWRTGGIGDLEFILPNLQHLKEKYPSCTIHFACGPQYQSMIDNWDCIDKVLNLPFHLSYLARADYHAVFEGVIERCKEAHTENAYRLFTRWLGLNLPDEKLIPKQNPKEEKVKFCRDILKEWKLEEKEFIIFQLRASSPIRTPRPSFWKKIIDVLTNKGHNIVITDSPHMADSLDGFINGLENKERVFNFARHSATLDCSIAMTSLAKIAVATDSSLIHIAESLGISSFGLFGPFPGSIRLDTYKKAKWIESKCECAPCFIHSPQPCKYAIEGHSVCYDKINIDEIIEGIGGIL